MDQARDLLGEWFSALEKNGECTSFRLGRCLPSSSEPEWFVLPHARYDGIGGLAHVLRSYFRTEIELPRTQEAPPSTLRSLIAAVYWLFRKRPAPMQWKTRGLEAPSESYSAPSAFAWHLFSVARTEALRASARARASSLNAWLLWGLTRAIAPWLASARGSIEWIVPVNLRGAVALPRDTANSASTLDVCFPITATPEQIHAELQKELRRGAHWGAWRLVSWLRYLGPKALQAIVRHELQVRKHGSFSNLGRLEPRQGTAPFDDGEWWMAFNPVFRSRPIGAACLTWRGRLALTLQMHPALSRDPRDARELLGRWSTALESTA